MTDIALIGAGRMGGPMGARLIAAGHRLVVFDAVRGAADELAALGARVATAPGDAVAGADVTLVSLPTPAVVADVTLGEDGVVARCAAGSVLVDVSTGPPGLARRLADAGAARGVAVLDAPVSGGPLGAAAGTLAIMVGGCAAAYERVSGVLGVLGATVRHMGPPGAGQATKLANNLLAAVQMTALAEAVALARAEQLDPRLVYEVIAGASGDSSVLRQRFPVPGVLDDAPASHGWAALFPVDLLVKDLRLALDAARGHGLDFAVASCALRRYGAAQDAGWGALDYSSVARPELAASARVRQSGPARRRLAPGGAACHDRSMTPAPATQILFFDGFDDLDPVAPLEILTAAGFSTRPVRPPGHRPEVRSAHGLVLTVADELDADAELVVVPGGGWRDDNGGVRVQARGELPARLAALHAGGAVIGSVCTGAMLLAAAGLVDGRPAVTNRIALDDLAGYGARVDAEARVVDDGDIVTCGGPSAGLDFGIRLVARFLGAEAGAAAARRLEYEPVGPVRVTAAA